MDIYMLSRHGRVLYMRIFATPPLFPLLRLSCLSNFFQKKKICFISYGSTGIAVVRLSESPL